MTIPERGELWQKRNGKEFQFIIGTDYATGAGTMVSAAWFNGTDWETVGGWRTLDDWNRWSADAVRVWPRPTVTITDLKPRRIDLDDDDLPPVEAKPAGETVKVRRVYTYSPSGDKADGVFETAGDQGGWWDDEVSLTIDIAIPLPPVPPVPTVTASVVPATDKE